MASCQPGARSVSNAKVYRSMAPSGTAVTGVRGSKNRWANCIGVPVGTSITTVRSRAGGPGWTNSIPPISASRPATGLLRVVTDMCNVPGLLRSIGRKSPTRSVRESRNGVVLRATRSASPTTRVVPPDSQRMSNSVKVVCRSGLRSAT